VKSAPKVAPTVSQVTRHLRSLADRATLVGMSRYAIPSDGAFGVPVHKIRAYAKELGRQHALAQALWKTGQYESRMLACFLADPERVTPALMDAWTRSFDSWAICDTACFHLFDRSPFAFAKIKSWSSRRREFEKRAAFALLASVALHDKAAPDEQFLATLDFVARAATDERNFVKKGVSWALRGIGRRGGQLHHEALQLARQLAASDDLAARWVGRDALRDLQKSRPTTKSKSPTTKSRRPS